MADAVNLNRFRKRKRREAEQLAAERNRVVHGLGKSEKQIARLERARSDRALEGARRELEPTPECDDPPDPADPNGAPSDS